MPHSLFTSESVSCGHPDKIADQISDAILDACLSQDAESRVACETLVTTGLVIIAGEITTKAHIDYQAIVRHTIEKIGYDESALGFDFRSCGIISSINKQSPDISQGVTASTNTYNEMGAGDQGMMFGFAIDETPELMPLPITLANHLILELEKQRTHGILPYLRPDAKSQVTIEYDSNHKPLRVHTIVISTQHSPEASHPVIIKDMIAVAKHTIPAHLIDDKTLFYVNPTGRFVIGGPVGDCGLTGRKIMVDTYGGMGRHGGGAFSGKDPSKVDRSGAYAARYVAKHIVAAKLASRCEIQIAYAIGVPQPVSIKVDTFGTGKIDDGELAKIIPQVFNLSPNGIIQMLNLKRPIYQKTAFGGHFGRSDKEFTWEQTDRMEALLEAVKKFPQSISQIKKILNKPLSQSMVGAT